MRRGERPRPSAAPVTAGRPSSAPPVPHPIHVPASHHILNSRLCTRPTVLPIYQRHTAGGLTIVEPDELCSEQRIGPSGCQTTIMYIPLLLSLSLVVRVSLAQPGTCSAQDVKRLVATISADSMMGRAPGSRGDTLTTAYLTRVLEGGIGLAGAVRTQPVPIGSDGATSRNIIATMPGSRDEWVVLTAHHDGLGVGRPDARGDSIYIGGALFALPALWLARELEGGQGSRSAA